MSTLSASYIGSNRKNTRAKTCVNNGQLQTIKYTKIQDFVHETYTRARLINVVAAHMLLLLNMLQLNNTRGDMREESSVSIGASQETAGRQNHNNGAMKKETLAGCVIWHTLGTITAIQLLAFDCAKNTTKVSQVANNIVEPCEPTKSKITNYEITIQAIQQKLYGSLHVYHCLITKTSITTHCGHFSYASVYKNGFSEDVLKVSPETCKKMHDQQIFEYRDTTFTDLKPNTTQTVSFVEHGHIMSDGTCSGKNFQTERGFFQNAVMQTSIRIQLQDYNTISNKKDEIIYFSDGQSCAHKHGHCFSSEKGVSIWVYPEENCENTEADIIYEGIAKIATSRTDSNGTLMAGDAVIVETATKLFAHEITGVSHLCYQKIFDTNLPRIKIIVYHMNPLIFTHLFTQN